MAQYFTDDFIKFFTELSENNNKEWFHSQKKRYESSVKNPFECFISDLIVALQTQDLTLDILAKNCILRINKDIRFSKDKSPYNLHYTAFVSHKGRKDKSIPGIFIRMSPQMLGIMGGCFGPDKEQLSKIRTAIQAHPETFNELISNKDFKTTFGEIQGEKMKRIPKELQPHTDDLPILANKQFYFIREDKPSLITSPKLLETVVVYWQTMRPLNEFLLKAIT
ncbi:MAG: DUF2461 domain-containing protein [Cyclobacteriaceae bacterium]